MSNELAKDFVVLLTYLLPGFLAAWVFYGLTSHPKPSQFERVVQALVFTFIIQILISPCRWALEQVGQVLPIRPWDNVAEGLTSLILAIVFGTTLAYFTNTDSAHKWLRKIGFTTRTSHPSEWYCVLSEKVVFVILHLCDGRRLYGWPKEWPIEPDKGQFYIMLPSWIQDDGRQIELPQLDGILMSVKDVRWVEFVGERKVQDDQSQS
jgi:predicted ribosomally synthesized peptide with SipW-like signal peptide